MATTLAQSAMNELSHQQCRDPFHLFCIDPPKCTVLKVTVLSGRRITKGSIWDFFDTPDPYLQLRIDGIPEGVRWTECKSNTSSPQWNEQFTFILPPYHKKVLTIQLMEANYGPDTLVATEKYDIHELPDNKEVSVTIGFGWHGQVDFKFHQRLETEQDIKFTRTLCPEEIDFRNERLPRAFDFLRNYLPPDQAPNNLDETPRIAVLGSGGGFRAMIGFVGVLKALEDTQLLDSVAYLSALSGSSWALSWLYSHPEWPTSPIGVVQKDLQEALLKNPLRFLNPTTFYELFNQVMDKRNMGQPISFTDFFGLMIGNSLLEKAPNARLSDQRAKVVGGKLPLPVYNCIHVKKSVSAKKFQEHVEFTPFVVTLPKYGCYLPCEYLGDKFYLGRVVKHYQEPGLHYLQGILGSAYTVLMCDMAKNAKAEEEKAKEITELAIAGPKVEVTLDVSVPHSHKHSECPNSGHMSVVVSNRDYLDDDDELHDDDSTDSSAAEYEEFELEVTDEKNKKIQKKSKNRTASASFWSSFTNSFNIMNSRRGRAAVVHNFMRGLRLENETAKVPTFEEIEDDDCFCYRATLVEQDEFKSLFHVGPQWRQRHMYLVDAGLTFNSPYPSVLRPQREVDLILSFDFSAREKDAADPFEEIKLAHKWARLQDAGFPEIKFDEYELEGDKNEKHREVYIFRNPKNPAWPVIMHFVLTNNNFRNYLAPGRPRQTEEEKEFGEFSIFDDPKTPYSTFNFTYKEKEFNRLFLLSEFNTLYCMDKIKECIAECVQKRRNHQARTRSN